MLVLTRKVNEEVVIGDDIVVRVTHVGGNQVKIAIEAPKAISVHRREIYERIKNEAQDA